MKRDVLGGGQSCGLAAAPQNTTNSHSETLCIELVSYHFEAKAFLM